MKYKTEKQNNPDHALITAVISTFRSIAPSYHRAHTWYIQKNLSTSHISPVKVRSKYYIPLFGSVFASALAFVMILTSQNNIIPTENIAFNARNTENTLENNVVATFSNISTKTTSEKTVKKQVLAKIDEQSKAISRTQADESFTESLNTETSLTYLLE
jgi:hypothetical protein